MKVTIIGAAGTLGSCAAFNIITHKLADELILIDPWESALKAHWIDFISVAVGQDVDVRIGKYEDMAGSDFVVMMAGAPSGVVKSRAELLPANLPIIKDTAEKINRYCPDAVVITETNPVDPLNYAMYLLSPNRNRRQYLGYSLNDTLRFRMWIAEAFKVKSSQVQGVVMGEHGHTQVMLFSSLRINGKPVEIDEQFKKNIREQPPIILNLFETSSPKRTAGWTSAVGTVALINAIKNDTGELIPSNVVLQGEYGYRDLSMTVPSIIGKGGLKDIQILKLAADEIAGLKVTTDALIPRMRYVEEFFGLKP